MQTFQCKGCIYADIQVISVYRPYCATSWYGKEHNELSIYCHQRGHMVKFPYERCKTRKERPKTPIDAY